MSDKRKGKILKVRLGYNANSSSLATIVTVFMWGATAAVIVVNMVAAVLFSKTPKKKASEE